MQRTFCVGVIATCLIGPSIAVGSAQQPRTAARSLGPPVPFEDVGACPFEGCVYREWIANAPVDVRSGRRPNDPVVFTLKPGDRVRAITGIVVTVKPGRVKFRAPIDLASSAGTVHVQPGETLYLLTYHGEGETTAWFKGRIYDWLDGSEFFNALCESKPNSCNGSIVAPPQRVWWVRLRTLGGITGWTRETDRFDNKDAFG
jgi:hypothetical protein